MKKVVFILMVVFATQTGIAQVMFPNAQAVISYVSGTWDWTRSCGGITGGCSTPQTTGMTWIVHFSPYGSDSLIRTDYINGSLTGTQNIYVHLNLVSQWLFEDLNSGYMQTFNAIHQDTIEFPNNMTDQFARSTTSGLNTPRPATATCIFPNPATDRISFLPANGTMQISEVYDMLGNKLITVSNANSIDISMLNKGVYLLCAKDENHTYVQRFVKE